MGGLTGDSRPSEVGGITAMARKVLKVFGNVFKVQLFWTFSCCHIFLSFSDLQLCFTSAYSLWSCCWVFAAGFYSALLPSDVPNALSLSWTSGWGCSVLGSLLPPPPTKCLVNAVPSSAVCMMPPMPWEKERKPLKQMRMLENAWDRYKMRWYTGSLLTFQGLENLESFRHDAMLVTGNLDFFSAWSPSQNLKY